MFNQRTVLKTANRWELLTGSQLYMPFDRFIKEDQRSPEVKTESRAKKIWFVCLYQDKMSIAEKRSHCLMEL